MRHHFHDDHFLQPQRKVYTWRTSFLQVLKQAFVIMHQLHCRNGNETNKRHCTLAAIAMCACLYACHWTHRVSLCNDTKELDNVWVTELGHDMSLLEEHDPLLYWCINAESLDSHLSHLRALTPCSLVHRRKLSTATLIQDAVGDTRACMPVAFYSYVLLALLVVY